VDDKPQLIVSQWVRGQPLGYECSDCGHEFSLDENLDPTKAAARLIAAFRDHLVNVHPEEL
jgi:hypothetical protein